MVNLLTSIPSSLVAVVEWNCRVDEIYVRAELLNDSPRALQGSSTPHQDSSWGCFVCCFDNADKDRETYAAAWACFGCCFDNADKAREYVRNKFRTRMKCSFQTSLDNPSKSSQILPRWDHAATRTKGHCATITVNIR